MASGIKPGEYNYLWMASDLDPASLGRERMNNADMVGMIQVYRDEANGGYQFILVTSDRGHFGTFGYAYGETPNKFPSLDEMWYSERQIDSHWWIAANRSW